MDKESTEELARRAHWVGVILVLKLRAFAKVGTITRGREDRAGALRERCL